MISAEKAFFFDLINLFDMYKESFKSLSTV
jgi:hypothetical protein